MYDSGCFHHLPPHQRGDCTGLVRRALRPGGSGHTDEQVYERCSPGGGLGYTEAQLRAMWDQPPFSVRVLRQMRRTGEAERRFGEDFLRTLLAVKAAPA